MGPDLTRTMTAVVCFGVEAAWTCACTICRRAGWGFFVDQGTARFRNIKITGLHKSELGLAFGFWLRNQQKHNTDDGEHAEKAAS